MRHSLNLTPKIIIIIAAPLLVELGLLAAIAGLQNEAEAEAARALRASRLSKAYNQLENDLFAFTAESFGENAIPFGGGAARMQEQMAKLNEDYENLSRAIGGNEKELEILNASKKNLEAAADMAAECLRSYLRAGDQERRYRKNLYVRLRGFAPAIMSDDMANLGRDYERYLERSPEKQMEFRNQARTLLLVGGAANVLLSIAVVLYLTRRVINRLKIMNENASLLARGEALHDKLPGHDEIASLDQSFHNMADALNQAKQMRQEIVTMITHDLRTPMTTIQNCLEMIVDGDLGTLNDNGVKLTAAAHYNCDRVMSLVDDFLDVERIRSGKMPFTPKSVPLNEIIESACEGLTQWAGTNGVTIKYDTSDTPIDADRKKLTRVLTNLIANAVKHSPAGGTVNVKGSVRDKSVEIEVSDKGKGIAPADIEKIFERFEQGTIEKDDGSGLGLYICKAFVELHRGSITVTSNPNGTVFTVVLPL